MVSYVTVFIVISLYSALFFYHNTYLGIKACIYNSKQSKQRSVRIKRFVYFREGRNNNVFH